MDRLVLHILGGDSRSRAEQARICLALGHHAEIYADLDEIFERPPVEGLVIAADDGRPWTVAQLIVRLGERGVWLPVIMAAEEPPIERVVAAIKAGALDYLALPLEMGSFARRLEAIAAEAGRHIENRRREVQARRAIARLSRREREVLELLSAGSSNKEIAVSLAISPRTVEIHRSNMMAKLGANHPADVVRMWLDAKLDLSARIAAPRRSDSQRPPVAAPVRIGERAPAAPTAERRRQRQ
jgi:FixJ family two-component response regulator